DRPQGPKGRKGPAKPGRKTGDGPAHRFAKDGGRSGERPSARPGRRPAAQERPDKPWPRQARDERTFREGDPGARRPFRKGERSNRFSLPNPANEGLVRLNKYLAQAGVGSRREADELITSGAVTVNGKVVTELGTKVQPGDTVHF